MTSSKRMTCLVDRDIYTAQSDWRDL